jgi:hypothetical protein
MKTITLTLTQEQLHILNAALGDVPYRVAAPLIANINNQIQRQFEREDDDAPTGSNHNLPQTDSAPNNL